MSSGAASGDRAGAAPGRGAGTRGPPTQRDTQAGGREQQRRGQGALTIQFIQVEGPHPGVPRDLNRPFAGSQSSRFPSIITQPPPGLSNLKEIPSDVTLSLCGLHPPNTRDVPPVLVS